MKIYLPVLRSLGEVGLIIFLFSGTLNSADWLKKHLSKDNDLRCLFAHSYNPDLKYEDDIYKRYKIVPDNVECLPTSYPNTSTSPVIPFTHIKQSALGQTEDIDLITHTLANSQDPVLAIGLQHGAISWLNAAARSHNIPKIHALVLDTPCADVNEIICNATYFNYIPGGKFIITRIAKFVLGFYNPDGIQPIDSIKDITNKALPIYIIHSKEDKFFPINESRKLYLEFLRCGFTNVYLIEVPHGDHKQILNNVCYRMYQQTVHQFYKKFNLPYDIGLAQLTQHIKLKNYQPDAETVMARMQMNIFEEYRATIVKTIILLFIAYKCYQYFPKTSSKIQNCIFCFLSLFKKSVNIKSNR